MSDYFLQTCLTNKVPEDIRHLTGQYIHEYLQFLHEKKDEYELTLQQHRQLYPSMMSIDPETIDHRLKEFVSLHHLNFRRLTQFQVNRFRDEIQAKQLWEHLERYSFSKEQVRR
jgi:hypothetical protein